ncbi:MAG: trehalase family glycosidase, partial [Gemmatimonadales bacterium]
MIGALRLLERDDKHYLGSGSGMIFAPRFPCWLDRPGFWDEVDIYNYQIAPLFTVTFLKVDSGLLTPLRIRQRERRWSPAELVGHYELGDQLVAREHRTVIPGGRYLSEWATENQANEAIELIAVVWSAQDTEDVDLASVRVNADSVSWLRRLEDRCGGRLDVEVTLGSFTEPIASAAYLSERSALQPRWELTPFVEKWRRGPKSDLQLSGVSPAGLLYLAVASRLVLPPRGGVNATYSGRVAPVGLSEPSGTGVLADHLRSHAPPKPNPPVDAPLTLGDPGAVSRRAWRDYFETLPALTCSDPFFERYWYYRWYGMQLCGHEGGVGNYVYPGCCEGTGYFHAPISYSAQCHARELRWLPDPDRARGVILNFLSHQKESGQLHGRLYLNHLQRTDFYFADWGEAVLSVDAVHPDPRFLQAVYRPLTLYAEWLDRERDPERCGLPDVVDHFETGQEFMSRYMAVSDEADSETWGSRIRLKGIDAAVYCWRLQRSLAVIAGRLHEFGDAACWLAAADRTAEAISERMWDDEAGMFFDVDPKNLGRTGVKAAVCFYPYFTELVGRTHVEGLRRHLLDPGEFWTEYPVPSTSADDPYYSPDAEWKDKRHNCPWNGRVWPMANSHVAEALAITAIERDADLRPVAAEFIRKFIRMLFHDGDPARPNC